FPWVVSAVKFGASLLIRNAMLRLRVASMMELVAGRQTESPRIRPEYCAPQRRAISAGGEPDGPPREPRRWPGATRAARARVDGARSGATSSLDNTVCLRQHTRARSSRRRSRMARTLDRKSTRLNSSHDQISYAVLCLK